MSRRRFLKITKYLHFYNDEIIKSRETLDKLAPIVKFFNDKFKELYVLEEHISIDESLIKFKGRMKHKVFNPSKRARFGIKLYKLCESASGYCHSSKIYAGNDNDNLDFSSSEAVVVNLMKPIKNKGHTLYIDNWYSSPKLFRDLVRNGTNAIGTVRVNRKNMPGSFVKKKLKKGDYIAKRCNGIIAMKWKDKRDVHILSTVHKNIEMNYFFDNYLGPQKKPNCVIDYNSDGRVK